MEESHFNYQPRLIEAVLLSIATSEGTVVLRIDNNSLLTGQYDGPMITSLILNGCELTQDILSELSNGIDQSIWFEIDPDENSIAFWLNYIDDPMTVKYADISKKDSDYTYDDLVQKSKRLARLDLSLEYENWQLRKEHHHFLEQLKKAVEKEMDTAVRKNEFFRERNPEKAANFRGELEAFTKILSEIKEQEGKGD